MNTAFAISLSGMAAAKQQLQTSAHNIANSVTADFKRQQVTQQSLETGGVRADVQASPIVGHSLENDLVAQLQAKASFQANLAVFRAADQMLGRLLDAVI